MISDSQLKRWKRDALEEQFNLKSSNIHNPTLNLQCERVARLCSEISKLKFERDLINSGGSNGQS